MKRQLDPNAASLPIFFVATAPTVGAEIQSRLCRKRELGGPINVRHKGLVNSSVSPPLLSEPIAYAPQRWQIIGASWPQITATR